MATPSAQPGQAAPSILIVESNHALTDLNSFSNRVTVGLFFEVHINDNNSLSDCCGINDLLNSGNVTGGIYISNNHTGCDSQPEINSYCGGDSDGYTIAIGDCDDANDAVHPGASDNNCDGIDNDCDGTADNGGPDDDCDGMINVCDICPGGDDSVDNNHDGLADCKYPPVFASIIAAWKCGNIHNEKVYVCHNGMQTKCINYGQLAAHIAHGDYLGPCGNANCNGARGGDTATDRSEQPYVQIAELAVSPNPTSTETWLDLSAFEGSTCTVRMLDLRGAVVQQLVVPEAGSDPIRVDLGNMAAGLYFVRVSAEGYADETLKPPGERSSPGALFLFSNSHVTMTFRGINSFEALFQSGRYGASTCLFSSIKYC